MAAVVRLDSPVECPAHARLTPGHSSAATTTAQNDARVLSITLGVKSAQDVLIQFGRLCSLLVDPGVGGLYALWRFPSMVGK